jgi:phospholipid/cholesterol/gamma-HCH transport system substrate-binding protein
MPSEKIKFSVGLFVAGGIVIALLVFIWLGMSRFLEKGRYYVTYLNESVQGLEKDSPVKYRGVTIGRVDKIRVAPDSKLIELVLLIESGQKLDREIVARLKTIGITGSMFIELDRRKKGEPDLSPYLTFPSEYPIISSKPSEVRELIRGFDEVLGQIRAMDLQGISEKVKLTLDSMNQAIVDTNMRGLSQKAGATMGKANESLAGVDKTLARVEEIFEENSKDIQTAIEELQTVMENTNKLLQKGSSLASGPMENTLVKVEEIVTENEKAINTTIKELRAAVENANRLLKEGSVLVTGTDETLDHFNRHQLVVAQNLEKATENLNRLIEILAQQPSQLLFGEPPARREIEPGG